MPLYGGHDAGAGILRLPVYMADVCSECVIRIQNHDICLHRVYAFMDIFSFWSLFAFPFLLYRAIFAYLYIIDCQTQKNTMAKSFTFRIKPGSECSLRKSYPRLHWFFCLCQLLPVKYIGMCLQLSWFPLQNCCFSKSSYPRRVSHAISRSQPGQDRQ